MNTLLRLAAGTYFVLTSLYCLLAYLPYTYCAFIKAPPYQWMITFTHHQAGLYWMAAAAGVAANWPVRQAWRKGNKALLAGVGLLILGGVYLGVHPFLPSLQNNSAAYWLSLASLVPVIGLVLWRPSEGKQGLASGTDGRPFAYSAGVLVAVVVSAVYVFGARMAFNTENRAQDAEIALWTIVTHLVVAVAILSVLNLIFLVTQKSSHARRARLGLVGAAIVVTLSVMLSHFLDTAMSFDGFAAYAYAAALSVTLTVWGFSLVLPFLQPKTSSENGEPLSRVGRLAIWLAMVLVTSLAVASRWLIGGEDWNGLVASTWAVIFWVVMSLCLYRLRPARAHYSAVAIVGILLVSAFIYKGLQITDIFWSKSLGTTDDEISLKLEEYAEHDASFQLAHHVLGNNRIQACGDLCRILREYTNVRDAHTRADVELVDTLTPASGPLPNIFVFVIDSMRPDYIGAYNPRVTYTPNMDALARDGVVFHHAYSQYAGTSLSEPVFWTGALLLHAHYVRPFSRLNALDKMLRADHYRITVSMDDVLTQILKPADEIVQIDTDKKLWNSLEISSTVKQLPAVLDAPRDALQPLFFFTQPKNVHQFARNNVPSAAAQHWQSPPGMDARISCEVHWVDQHLGEFFRDLKRRGMYDNSIIIVTSDHGDATGEWGRVSHSLLIWPEIMHVPLIIHLPPQMRKQFVHDDTRLATLTDVVPTLYYLLGHRPIRQNPLYGRPLFAETQKELDRYPRHDLLLASDAKAVYGILTGDGRYFYTTYDAPAQSYLFDLTQDPNALHPILTPQLKQRYDEEIIAKLQEIGDYYGYKPSVGSLVASASRR